MDIFPLPAAASSGPWVEIETVEITTPVDSLDIGLTGGYDIYKLEIQNLEREISDGNLNVRVSEDGGATFAAGVTDYTWTSRTNTTASTTSTGSKSTGNSLGVFAVSMLAGSNGGFSGDMIINNAKSATRLKHVDFSGCFINTTSAAAKISGTITYGGGAINAIRLTSGSAQTLSAGRVKLMGMNL